MCQAPIMCWAFSYIIPLDLHSGPSQEAVVLLLLSLLFPSDRWENYGSER